MLKNKTVSSKTKKDVIKRQNNKCANSPGSNYRGLEGYDCLVWKTNNGNFEYVSNNLLCEVDHVIERSITRNDDSTNLKALCLSCHGYKTKQFQTTKLLDRKVINNPQNKLLVDINYMKTQKFYILDDTPQMYLLRDEYDIENDKYTLNDILPHFTINQLWELAMILGLPVYEGEDKNAIFKKILKEIPINNTLSIINRIKNKRHCLAFRDDNSVACHYFYTNNKGLHLKNRLRKSGNNGDYYECFICDKICTVGIRTSAWYQYF
jgi:hypothetical protein